MCDVVRLWCIGLHKNHENHNCHNFVYIFPTQQLKTIKFSVCFVLIIVHEAMQNDNVPNLFNNLEHYGGAAT